MNKVLLSSKSNEWQTPKFLFDYLNKEFDFQLDAAANVDNALCSKFFTQEDDSLSKDWFSFKSIFCNPPYGRLISKFVEKAFTESQKGCIVVLLIPARTDTKWWHKFCSFGEVRFLAGRLKFINRSFPTFSEDGNFKISPAPFPSAIVVFRPYNKQITKYINLK